MVGKEIMVKETLKNFFIKVKDIIAIAVKSSAKFIKFASIKTFLGLKFIFKEAIILFKIIFDFIKKHCSYIKYELCFLISVLILLFFLLHSKIVFSALIMTIMLLCAFDSFNIFAYLKENYVDEVKKLTKLLFVYLLLPFICLMGVYFTLGIDFTYWILILIIFNKMLCYIIDNVLESDVLPYKVYANRSILSIVNSVFFTIFISFIFSIILKRNTFTFILLNILITCSIFMEESIIYNYKNKYKMQEVRLYILPYLMGFATPLILSTVMLICRIL